MIGENTSLRVGFGLLFHPRSHLAVSGYTAYTARVLRVLEASPDVEAHPWTEPGPHVLGPASPIAPIRAAHRVLHRYRAAREQPPVGIDRAPEILPPGAQYTAPNERRIEGFRQRMAA